MRGTPLLCGPLSAAAAQLGGSLREEAASDVDFLRRLYVSTRWEELAQTVWTEQEKAEFLTRQFAAQSQYYDEQYRPVSEFLIIEKLPELESGPEPVGRLYLCEGVDEIRIVDIALLPQWRGRGAGSLLLRAVLEMAYERQRSVGVHVEQFNPALRLYRRLGFRAVYERGPYLFMRREAEGKSPVHS